MSSGENVDVRVVDVDLVRKGIHVKTDEEFRVKGGNPRAIPMNDWVYNFLLLGSKAQRGEYVFSNGSEGRLTGDAVSHRFKRYVRKAGSTEGIHFHSLRHTGMSWVVNRGMPQPFVQRLAGHPSPNVTQIYTHLEHQCLTAAVNSFPILN